MNINSFFVKSRKFEKCTQQYDMTFRMKDGSGVISSNVAFRKIDLFGLKDPLWL